MLIRGSINSRNNDNGITYDFNNREQATNINKSKIQRYLTMKNKNKNFIMSRSIDLTNAPQRHFSMTLTNFNDTQK